MNQTEYIESLIEMCRADFSAIPEAQALARQGMAKGDFSVLNAFKDACYEDVALFGKFFLSEVNMVRMEYAKHHYAFFAAYDAGWGADRLNFIAPRDTAKTTVGGKIIAIHAACYFNLEGWRNGLRNGNTTFMTGSPLTVIASASTKKATRDLASIKMAIDNNDLISAAFAPPGHKSLRVRSDRGYFKWHEEEVILANGAHIVALGRGSQVRGINNPFNFRITLFIGDDLESEKNVTNDQIIEETRIWFYNAVLPAIFDEPLYTGRVIILGTVVHDQCLVNHIRHKDPSFETLFFQLIYTDEKGNEQSLWPEKFSLKRIHEKRANWERGGRLNAWLQEYMNIAMAQEERPFRADQIQYWEGDFTKTNTPGLGLLHVSAAYGHDRVKKVDLPEYFPVSIWIGVDFASTDSVKSDFTVMSVVATDHKGNCFLVDYVRARLITPSSRADALFELARKYDPNLVVIETIGDQNTTFMYFREVQRTSNHWFRMVPEKHRRQESKQERITGDLEPRFNAGAFFFKSSGQAQAVQEFVEFPQADHDDIPDSIQMAVHHSRRCPHQVLPNQSTNERERDEEYEFDALTAA